MEFAGGGVVDGGGNTDHKADFDREQELNRRHFQANIHFATFDRNYEGFIAS